MDQKISPVEAGPVLSYLDLLPPAAYGTVQYPELFSPDVAFPELWQSVALQRAALGFRDGKPLVDMVPIDGPEAVRRRFETATLVTDEDRALFWRQNFEDPDYVSDIRGAVDERTGVPLETHLREMWPRLTYHSAQDDGTLLGTNHPRLKPGERYSEGYYWDTSDGMEGMIAEAVDTGDPSLWRQIFGELRNFADKVERFGFIPNGDRSYYLSRSQPPKYAHMVKRVAESYQGGLHKNEIIEEFLPQIVKEYEWWMKGRSQLDARTGVRAADHVVLMPGGEILNRYWDTKDTPRPESEQEDKETAKLLPPHLRGRFNRNIRIIAASGRDMNGELLDDPERLETACAEQVVPVELNSLLWEYEDLIATAHEAAGRSVPMQRFRAAADARAAAINRYCYTGSDSEGYYCGFKFRDTTFTEGAPTGYMSMNMAYPVARGLASPERAESVCRILVEKFLQAGGFVASLHQTGHQWDWPNGWAPDQEEAQNALLAAAELTGNNIWRMWANVAKTRWANHHGIIYRMIGKIAEKCNVVLANPLDVQNGEYALQFGFLWTNGILRKFLSSMVRCPTLDGSPPFTGSGIIIPNKA